MLTGSGNARAFGDSQRLAVLDAVSSHAVDGQHACGHGAGVVHAMFAGGGNISLGQLHRTAVVIDTVDGSAGDHQRTGGGQLGVIVDAVVAGILDCYALQSHRGLVLDAVAALAGAIQSGVGQRYNAAEVIADAMLARFGNS